MTLKECIDIVDNIKPNQYTIKEKVMWLSFIEEKIINDVIKTHEGYDGRYDDFEGYSEDRLTIPLIVPSPYDRLYTEFLKMQIDNANGEMERYNNSAALYNSYMLEYRKYYNKTHMPLDTTRSRDLKPLKKASVGLSEAEYENLVKDLTFKLTERFSDFVSPDKLYDIVMSYVRNNIELLKGKDGYTPKRGVDYWNESDIGKITEDISKMCAEARESKDAAVFYSKTASKYAEKAVDSKLNAEKAMNVAKDSADIAHNAETNAEEFKKGAQNAQVAASTSQSAAESAASTAQKIADSMSFWDTFQESGMRENYQGMDGGAGYVKPNSFGGCKDKYIYPKYPLHPVMAYGMFHMCENLVVAPEVDFSQCTNMTAIFNTCPKLKKVGRIESYTAPGATYLFTKCKSLETVEYINLPNATNYIAAFNECDNLQNIRFAKGSIRCTAGGKISFHHCPNLTVDTIDSIFEGLGEVSGFPIVQFDNYGNNIATYDSAKGVEAFQKLIDEATLKGWNVIPSLYA